jgi:predicted PolB exonuclease-like 3'-5' exonuclease
MDGSMVAEYWFTGRHQEIYEYCMLDVPALVNCYRRLMGEPVFTPDLIEWKKS